MALPSATQRVLAELSARGLDVEILISPTTTKTAAEAAAAIGTRVAQIVKSLLFLVDERPVLALMSGTNRLDEGKLARALGGEKVARANAQQVRDLTTFVIGGVPPVSVNPGVEILVDVDLLQFPVVYAAAGTPNHNFAVEPRRLVVVARAKLADLKVDQGKLAPNDVAQ
jgi:prolyl-tRNA editing enzyme YbaK/EbsC (Cys-tRNA(Pro) deacylase)